jgi:malate/lactate dehydrogenase
MPRKPGMDREELFAINAEIFKNQGLLIDKAAKKTCKFLVVANPVHLI